MKKSYFEKNKLNLLFEDKLPPKKGEDKLPPKKDNSDFENWKKDHPESAGWVLYSKKEDCNKYWDTNKYQRDYKYNKDEQKTYCAIKNIGGTSVTPPPGPSGYKECPNF